jgi:glycosyltransferase involved in cell wall biosynthesis
MVRQPSLVVESADIVALGTAMNDNPLVTVALAAHNGEAFLDAQLDSVLGQKGVRLEVIAIDDASRDGTRGVLDRHARSDTRIRVFANETNLGATKSFERAMSLAKGDFIAPSDQDDIWLQHKLERLVAAIGAADIAYCDSELIDADGTPLGRRISSRTKMMQGGRPLRFVLRNTVSGHAMLFRRDLFDIARPFPGNLYHDWWLALAAASRQGIVYVDEPLVQFRRHENTISKLGRGGLKGMSTRNRFWLDQRRSLLAAYASSMLEGHEIAARLLEVFGSAECGTCGPLFREIWRNRVAFADGGSPALDAVRLQLRFLRKRAGAKREAR